MTTALKIIERAFSKAGIKPAETPLQASEIEDGLDALNDLIASWNATGTLKGVDPLSDVNDDFLAPRHSHWAFKANLAVSLASEYSIPVSQGMAFDASNSLAEMVKAETDLRFLHFPSTLPKGSGNQDEFGVSYDSEFYPEDQRDNF